MGVICNDTRDFQTGVNITGSYWCISDQVIYCRRDQTVNLLTGIISNVKYVYHCQFEVYVSLAAKEAKKKPISFEYVQAETANNQIDAYKLMYDTVKASMASYSDVN